MSGKTLLTYNDFAIVWIVDGYLEIQVDNNVY